MCVCLPLQKQLRVNVLGSVRPTQVLLPDMIEKQEGRIVFISSVAGQVRKPVHLYLAFVMLVYWCFGRATPLPNANNT